MTRRLQVGHDKIFGDVVAHGPGFESGLSHISLQASPTVCELFQQSPTFFIGFLRGLLVKKIRLRVG